MKRAVVIGSGMGGLTSALLLQKKGYEVTVLEQHTRPGGMMHRFFREGIAYDTGFHYCGSIASGQPLGQIFRHLGIFDSLEFHSLDPDGFDLLQFPDRTLRVPTGWLAYRQRMQESFPHEAKGIESFLAELERAVDAYGLYRLNSEQNIERLLEVEGKRLLDAMLEHVSDPKLISALAGQCVLYGTPPNEASFGVHALIMDHFLQGAHTIRGGGDKLAMTLTRAIRKAGGKVQLRTAAVQIEVEDRRAKAVHTAEGERLEADLVVSNLHPLLTLDLLPESATRKAYRSRVRGNRVGYAHLGVYLEIDGPAESFGNHNIYRHTSWDADRTYLSTAPGEMGLYFASSPTQHGRSGDPGVVLMITPLDWNNMSQWADTAHGDRPPAYLEYKAALKETAIDMLLRDHPSLRGRIKRSEASTPLSTQHFTRTPNGATYGHLHSCDQMGRYRPSQRTRVQNLMLVGQGVFSPGILGTAVSAYYAMGQRFGLEELMKELREA